jgi:hypothetical protein
MGFDVLFEILRSLERLLAVITFVRLQWNVNPNVTGDVITLDRGGSTIAPSTGEIEVVCGLAANVILADMVLYSGQQLLLICLWYVRKEPLHLGVEYCSLATRTLDLHPTKA